jgi:hypothetical protein
MPTTVVDFALDDRIAANVPMEKELGRGSANTTACIVPARIVQVLQANPSA